MALSRPEHCVGASVGAGSSARWMPSVAVVTSGTQAAELARASGVRRASTSVLEVYMADC